MRRSGGETMRVWLVEKRKKKGYTQNQVSELSGISRSFYSEIENDTKDPGGKTAKKIADALDFDMRLFFEEKGRGTRHSA